MSTFNEVRSKDVGPFAPISTPHIRPDEAVGIPKPKIAPPGRCERCDARLSQYRNKKGRGSKGGWETFCSPCLIALEDERIQVWREASKALLPEIKQKEVAMATAVAPVKTKLRLPRRKWQREVQPGLEDLGFKFLGVDGSSHAIFQHPTAGQVRLASSPSGDPKESQKQALGRARRLLALQESEVGEFVHYLRELYGVLPHEAKIIRLNLLDEIKTWSRTAKPATKPEAIRSALADSDFVMPEERIPGARKQNWIIRGSQVKPEIVDEGVEVSKEEIDRRKTEWLDRIAQSGGAVAWLAEFLADGSARLVEDIEDKGAEAGLSWYAISNASKELGVFYERESKYQGKMLWRLPAPEDIVNYNPESNGDKPMPETPKAEVGVTIAEAVREPEPAPVAAPVSTPTSAPFQGDLLEHITDMVTRARRVDEAEAKAAVAADELRTIATELLDLQQRSAKLYQRVNDALGVIMG